MSHPAPATAPPDPSLEGVIKGEVLRMYQEVATAPQAEFHFYHGRTAARMYGYRDTWLDRAPGGAVESFAGVGNPHRRASLLPGETVIDLGSGAGLDSIIAAWHVGDGGHVLGVDFNPDMLAKARANATEAGLANVAFREGSMEQLPCEAESVDLVISNGVINLSLRKRHVIQEIFRVLRPGGRLSVSDIVSAKPLSQSIVNDPKLWAS